MAKAPYSASTYDLIEAALQAQADFDTASQNLQAASSALQTAQANLTAANQALHDDLATNGPAVIVDSSMSPPTVTLYTAVDPDSWVSKEIRVAQTP